VPVRIPSQREQQVQLIVNSRSRRWSKGFRCDGEHFSSPLEYDHGHLVQDREIGVCVSANRCGNPWLGILLPQVAEIQSSDRQRRGPRDRAPVAASRLRRRVEAAAAVRTWFRGQTPEGPLNPTFRTTHRKGPGAMNCMRCCSPSTLDLPSHFLCCLSLNILGPHTRCLSSGRRGACCFSALKVDQLLHLDTVVSTGGLEIISVGLISLVAVCAFLFLRLVGRTAYAQAVVPPHGPPEEIVQPFLKWMHGGSSEPRDYIILVDL